MTSYTFLFAFRYNIQYGRPGASDSEIVNAAENADIHERILTFPDKYDTQVDFVVIEWSNTPFNDRT